MSNYQILDAPLEVRCSPCHCAVTFPGWQVFQANLQCPICGKQFDMDKLKNIVRSAMRIEASVLALKLGEAVVTLPMEWNPSDTSMHVGGLLPKVHEIASLDVTPDSLFPSEQRQK